MLSLFEAMQRVSVRLMLYYTVLPPQKRLSLQSFKLLSAYFVVKSYYFFCVDYRGGLLLVRGFFLITNPC